LEGLLALKGFVFFADAGQVLPGKLAPASGSVVPDWAHNPMLTVPMLTVNVPFNSIQLLSL
jgi:hypothetical protein